MASRKKRTNVNRTCAYIFFATAFVIFWMLYLQAPTKSNQLAAVTKTEYVTNVDLEKLIFNFTFPSNDSEEIVAKYLVNSPKCKIPSLDPYNNEIMPYFSPKRYLNCSKKRLLTRTTKKNNVATLHVNEHRSGTSCCYSTVTRDLSFSSSDNLIDTSPCIEFFNSTVLPEDVAMVTCKNGDGEEIYKNVHAVVTINDKVQERLENFRKSGNKRHLSVLLIGIDSISRLNLIRSLPSTYIFLQQNEWLEFKGYNKIGDNTFPNLMGILTGMNESASFRECNPRISGQLDECSLIWYDYRNLGFVTGYAEDEAEINTFNYLKKGFVNEPTDYYFRPYILATEKYLKPFTMNSLKYCTGPETAGERIFNVAHEFQSTFADYPSFGFFWTNSFSHNDVNSVSRMDAKIVEFLSHMNQSRIFENTIMIF